MNSLPPVPGVSKEKWKQLSCFQQKVYRTVFRIPRGQVRSYQWVAKAAGNPRAARAVGQALHINPFAPQVPCHRVIRADGSLGGFAFGLKRKLQLLKREGCAVFSA